MKFRFRHTVPCSRPAVDAWTDDFGNTIGAARAALTFAAVFAAPTTQAGSQIVDGVLRETTITKPSLLVDDRPENLAVFAAGAVISGDPVVVDGTTGWEVDGDPAKFPNAFTGVMFPMVIELRKAVG